VTSRRQLLLAALAPARTWPVGISLKGFPGWPLERSLALCAELGYSGVELLAGSPPVRSFPVLSIMEDLRLTGPEEPERLEASLRLAKAISSRRPPVVETVVGGKPAEWPAIRPQFLERLKGWARLADRHRVPVAIKAHVGSALHRSADAVALIREIGSPFLLLNYDYSHFQLQGEALADSLVAALPYTAMIHITDSTGQAPNHRFVLPGEGTIDYAAYAALLRRYQYRGPIVIEVSTHVLQAPGYDPARAARECALRLFPHFPPSSSKNA
jgi:inosose dehydratase